jgi:hypothetical protein
LQEVVEEKLRITGDARHEHEQAIPPNILRQRHHELNLPCQNQTYTERASWFRFIDETYGRAATLAVAYSDVEVTNDVARTLIGASLAEIDLGWEQWVRDRYAAIPDAAAIAEAYRLHVPESVVCVAGVDY